MSVLDTKFVQGFIRMCDDGFKQNWHERNGGNLSYRIKPEEVDEVKEILTDKMKHAANLKVSLEVDAKTGASWFDAK